MGFEADERGAKKRDYWFTVIFTDPIATPLASFLAKKRWLTPNQVTVLALLLGLSVGAFFMLGQRWSFIAGGIAFYLAFVFDCVDGKLARATGLTSPKGQALDALADAGRRASALIGMAIAFRNLEVNWTCRDVVGFFGQPSCVAPPDRLMSLIVYALLAYFFLEISGAEKAEVGDELRGRWSAALARRRLLPNPGMPDVQAIVFIAGPISGRVMGGLYIGTLMVAAGIGLTVVRRLK